MSRQVFVEPKLIMVADAAAVGNTVTETIIVPDYTFPAGEFNTGVKYRGWVWGKVSNVVTAVPTMTFRVRIGAATLSATWVTASAAAACNASANTDLSFMGKFEIVCRTVGTAGTGAVMGNISLPNITGATSALVGEIMLPASAPTTGTLNTTIANVLSVSIQWSAANAANTITVTNYALECLT
jgi:hypothetical protein